jgi:ribosomal protein S3AE
MMKECSKKTSSKEKRVLNELIHQIIYNEWTKKICRSIRQILPLNHVFKKKSESHYHTYCIKHRQHKKLIKLYCFDMLKLQRIMRH